MLLRQVSQIKNIPISFVKSYYWQPQILPTFSVSYLISEGSDYAQQTYAVNIIDDILISELRRTVCYNQTIYNDLRLEPQEYIGLTLGVKKTPVETSQCTGKAQS